MRQQLENMSVLVDLSAPGSSELGKLRIRDNHFLFISLSL